jgi:hypothetical protein
VIAFEGWKNDTPPGFKRALHEAIEVLYPHNYDSARKVAAETLLGDFFTLLNRNQHLKPQPAQMQIQADRFLIMFNILEDKITAYYSHPNTRTPGPTVQIPLVYDFVDGWIGEVDSTIAPIPGQPFPRKEPLTVLMEVTVSILADATKWRNNIGKG